MLRNDYWLDPWLERVFSGVRIDSLDQLPVDFEFQQSNFRKRMRIIIEKSEEQPKGKEETGNEFGTFDDEEESS